MLGSCVQSNKIAYLQSNDVSDSIYFESNQIEYRIKKDDVLKVDVFGLDPNISVLFNSIGQNSNRVLNNNVPSILLEGHVVDQNGDIVLPMVGSIRVVGLTINNASDKIQKKLDKFFINAKAKVNLVSFRVTVLGEVNAPGVYYNYNRRITILEALGLAGDLTEFGDRDNIRLIRPSEEGNIVFTLSLRDQDILVSDYYYLTAGDTIYVSPVKGKTKRVNIPVLLLVFSAITTSFLVLNYFK